MDTGRFTVSAAARERASPLPPGESRLLLAHVLGKSREWVIAHPEVELTPEQQDHFAGLVSQAEQGVPLPYLLGHWEFFGLDFIVTPDVLIPRPETELLVEKAIGVRAAGRPATAAGRILDLGTGSGIIAIALALNLPHARITATDLSPAALAVAKANAGRQRVAGRIEFLQRDLLSGFSPQSFDLVCANLPYIPSADLGAMPVARHEPRVALDGGADGLGLIRRLLASAPRAIAPGGCVLLEIEYRQGPAVSALARESFPGAQVGVHPDLAGLERLVEIRLP